MPKKFNFKITGIHCKACKTLIEEELKLDKNINNANVNYLTGEASVETNGEKKEIYETVERLGYNIATKNDTGQKKTKSYLILGVLLIVFLIGYFIIQRYELFNLMSALNEQSVSFSIIFLIGVLASFHCIGMCGGLVITYSASNIEKNREKKSRFSFPSSQLPHLQYNIARLISYTAIGAILGGFGSFFGINPNFSGIIILLASVFMILMGASLLSNHSWLKKIKLRTPEFIAKFLYRNKQNQNPKGPFIIGLLTGFMPCGPLQAMQLFALTSGSIFNGAMAMFLYSLGTIPLMFGFGNFVTIIGHTKIKQVMKFSGVLVIVLGLFMFNRGLINFGYGLSSLIPVSAQSKTEFLVTGDVEEFQTVEMDITYRGYSPNVLYLKKDIPVRWIINDKGATGCTNEIFLYHPDGTIKKKIDKKLTVIEFTPTELGDLKFSCWMKMVWGKFIVTDDGRKSSKGLSREDIVMPEKQGGCNGSCGSPTCGGSKDSSTCGCGTRIKSN